jgi:hypothetical protein
MRGLTDIIKDNQAAEAAGHDVGGIGTAEDAALFPRGPQAPAPGDPAKDSFAEGPYNPPEERKINVLQLTIVHDVGRGVMTFTATTPYLEEPNDAVIVQLRNRLAKRFEELTEPGASGTVWGEITQFPGDPEQRPEIRVPGEKKLELVRP